MTEQAVREHAQAFCDALKAGDIGQAAEQMSRELQRIWAQSWPCCRSR